jgi:hypothetical protein
VGKSDHWYDQSGKPHHGAHLKEARANGYLPSVTTVLQCWPRGALDNWKQEQIILSCLTTPRLPNEGDDAYIARVIQCAEAEGRAAADVGTRRHKIIEGWLESGELIVDSWDMPFIQPFVDWYTRVMYSTLASERAVVHLPMGYAGKLDIFCNLVDGRDVVIDIKNRKRLSTYETDAAQLASYAMALRQSGVTVDGCISVILGTQEPGVHVKYWSLEDEAGGWEDFKCALALWKRSRNYWPEKFYQGAAA